MGMGSRGQTRTAQLIEKFQLQERKFASLDLEKSVKHLDKILIEIELLHCQAEQIIKKDIRLFVKENIVHRVWKISVYKYVHLTRELLKSQGRKERPDLSKFIQCLINSAQLFFDKLLKIIQDDCDISHDEITGHGIFIWKDENKKSYYKYAKECYIKTLILMGDTHRYSYVNPLKLKQAMEQYEIARSMGPTKGRSYHQLAVVTPLKHYVSKLYNLMRAYTAVEPQDEVKPELFIIFDEAYKEYKTIESLCWYAKAKTNEPFPNKYMRKEVWVYTLGGEPVPSIAEDPHSKETHFQNLSQFEVYRRFSVTYVQFIGKLFTGIDLDVMDVVAEESLIYFEGLLKKVNGNEFPSLLVIQVMALNMFIVDHIRIEAMKKPSSEYLETTVVNYVMEMFSLCCEKLAALIYCCAWDNTLLEPLCIGLQIWCEWLDMNRDTWCKRRPRAVFSVRHVLSTKYDNKRDLSDDAWVQFANLMSNIEISALRLKDVLFPSVSEIRNSVHCVPLCPLPECLNLASFRIFAGASILGKQYFADNTKSKMLARVHLRLKNIHEFGCKIVNEEDKILKREESFYNRYNYKSLVRTAKSKLDSETCGVDSRSYHFYTPANNPPILPPSKNKNNLRMNPLVRRPDCNNARIILRKKKTIDNEVVAIEMPSWKGMRKYEEWLYLSNRNYLMEILVDPVRLVIDTNCFINKFPLMKILITLVVRPIYVPVAVILELRGLSRGGLTAKDLARFGNNADSAEAQEKLSRNKDVAEKCATALTFIENHMSYFYIVTSTGRNVPAKSPYDLIKDDYFDPNRTNDDRIVDVCKYLESRDAHSRSKDCQRRIYRKTVLVTGDRNLRIRISTMDIPTRPLISIILWLNWKLHPETYDAYLKWLKAQARERRQARALRRETPSPTAQRSS